jgi:hypothetical protein
MTMSLEKRYLENDTIQTKIKEVTATYAMKVWDQILHITANSGTAITITLPSVAEAKGKFYSIVMLLSNTGDATVTDLENDAAFADMVLTATADRVLVYSDGIQWWLLFDLTT